MRFVHAADIHLDSPMRGLVRYPGAPVEAIREATRRAFVRLIELTLAVEAPLLLLAGDIYDGDWPDYRTGLFFNQQMVRLRDAGVTVALIRGNHDAQNRMTRSLALPDNVIRFSTAAPETHVLDQLGIALHGQSYGTQREDRNLAATYPDPVPGLLNIGLLHTSLDGRPGHEPYAPCRVEQLVDRGYQYWALGHVHRHEIVHRDPWVVYPGNLQGRHARELGPKGACIVETDGPSVVEVTHEPCDVMRWHRVEIDAHALESADDLVELAGARAELATTSSGMPAAVRVVVSGPTKLCGALLENETAVRAELQARITDLTGGDAWLERLVLDTTSIDLGAPVGPMSELLRIVEELAGDPAAVLDDIPELSAIENATAGLGAASDLDATTRLPVAAARLRAALHDLVNQR